MRYDARPVAAFLRYLYTFMLGRTIPFSRIFLESFRIFLIFIVLFASGCAEWLPDAYRLDLQQGNSVKREQRDRLEPGMSQREVRAILGEPMLKDPFHADRWDYIYRFIPHKGKERKSRLTLYFANGLLQRIDDSEYVEP